MWFHVFKKELFEMLRDRRVLVGSFVMPPVVIFLMFQLFGTIENSVKSQRTAPVTLVDSGKHPLQSQILKDNKVQTVKTLEEGKEQLKNGKAKLLLQFVTSEQDGRLKIEAYHDSTEPLSLVLLRAMEKSIFEQNRQMAVSELKSKGISENALEPIILESMDIADESARSASPIASLIPYLVILWAFYGGFASVSDMIAGEKERGTMETLLISPVRRGALLFGKWVALVVVCIASAFSGLIGIGLAAVSGQAGSTLEGGVNTGAAEIGSIILAMVPLVAMFASLLILVSTYAKNMREAQTYLTVASFIVLIPAVFSNVIGFTGLAQSMAIKFTPVLSASLALRGALLGRPDWMATMGSFSVCLVIAAVLYFVSLALFKKETILARV